MKVVEIFKSIEGEGLRAGIPCTFVRLFGCNLRCTYCDTRYGCEGTGYTEMSIEEIIACVKQLGLTRITLTGGEPLVHVGHQELIKSLLLEGFEVNIETNGSQPIQPILDSMYSIYTKNLIFTVDYKSISSGMNESMNMRAFEPLRPWDALKFVVGNMEDLISMKAFLDTNQPCCNVFVSPVFGCIELSEIADFILQNDLKNVRMQIQLHKIIWDPNRRGV